MPSGPQLADSRNTAPKAESARWQQGHAESQCRRTISPVWTDPIGCSHSFARRASTEGLITRWRGPPLGPADPDYRLINGESGARRTSQDRPQALRRLAEAARQRLEDQHAGRCRRCGLRAGKRATAVLICHTWRPPRATIDRAAPESNRAVGCHFQTPAGGRPAESARVQKVPLLKQATSPRRSQTARSAGPASSPGSAHAPGTGRQGSWTSQMLPPLPLPRPQQAPCIAIRCSQTLDAPGARRHTLWIGRGQTAGAQWTVVRSATKNNTHNGCGGADPRRWWSKKAKLQAIEPPFPIKMGSSPRSAAGGHPARRLRSCRSENPFEPGHPPAPSNSIG